MTGYITNIRSKIGHELLLLPSVAAVITNKDGKILLQEKAAGEGWSLPAGGIEPGESPEQAIIREVMEETGLHVAVETVLGVYGGESFRYRYPNGDQVEYTVILFRCQVKESTGSPTDPETRSLAYFTEKDMPLLALPYPKDVLFSHLR